MLTTLRQPCPLATYTEKVFTKVFQDDIAHLRDLKDVWKDRTPPMPLSWDVEALDEAAVASMQDVSRQQDVFDLRANVALFCHALARLRRRALALSPDNTADADVSDRVPSVELSFDKDDTDAMDFVTAAANIRASIFHIQRASRFRIQCTLGRKCVDLYTYVDLV